MSAKDKALLEFCRELLALLAYQPDIPRNHIEDLANKMQELENAIDD